MAPLVFEDNARATYAVTLRTTSRPGELCVRSSSHGSCVTRNCRGRPFSITTATSPKPGSLKDQLQVGAEAVQQVILAQNTNPPWGHDCYVNQNLCRKLEAFGMQSSREAL